MSLLTLQQAASLQGTRAADAGGRPLVLWHGTRHAFDQFGATTDLGFHFGLRRQAERRLQTLSAAEIRAAPGPERLIPVALRVTLQGATTAHHRLRADPTQLRAEIQAAADQCREDVWLEAVKLATRPAAMPPAPGGSDLPDAATVFEGAEDDPAIKALAADLLAQVMAKIPPSADGREALEAEIDAILADARSLALARAEAAGER